MITLIRHQRRALAGNNGCQAIRKFNKFAAPHNKSNLSLKYRLDGSSLRCVGSGLRSRSLQQSNYAAVLSVAHGTIPLTPIYSYQAAREFRLYPMLCESPSSKVEATVQTMKNKQKEKVEEIMKEAASSSCSAAPSSSPAAAQVSTTKASDVKAVPVKKSLQTRIWEEVLHYYHGFKLLFIDINVCRKLLWRVLNGKTLTRRENKLLVRTTSDVFRLIPFSVFIIVPFMELLLPVFIKFFPGMLPSTFQTAKEREAKLKQSLQVKLEMAKFLQKTLDEMAVQHKDHKSEEARQFSEFFKNIKNPNEYVSNEDIIKYSKRFEDEITLDSLSREQLAALCRVLELNTMGTTMFLRFQLRVKLRSLAADDRVIAREGVTSLNLCELQQACKSRGMRAYGLTAERLRSQLQEWIDLSLNEKVPPTLLLLSRAMLISDETTTTHKLKETIRVLPDAVAAKTKAAIGEREGKIDNKAKIEVIKEEERKIKEEREEEREEAKAKAETLLDHAPIINTSEQPLVADMAAKKIPSTPEGKTISVEAKSADDEKTISSKDVKLLGEALLSLSSDTKKMVVEKETIKELKEELEDYKEDLEELREVRQVIQEPVHESRAAKRLFKKVNKMISQLDRVLEDLEKKQKIKPEPQAAAAVTPTTEEAPPKRKEQELVYVEDLIHAIKNLQQTSDESRLKHIENVLSKLDADKDGVITVDEVLKVVEAIGRDNVNLSEKQVEELITLLDKEHLIEAEEKIEKALAKSIKEARSIEAKKAEEARKRTAEELKDLAPELRDKAKDLNVTDKARVLTTEAYCGTKESAMLEAAEKQKEKIIPKAADMPAGMPPTIPTPPPSTSTQANSKDKML